MTTIEIQSFQEMLTIASDFGIQSVAQLHFFLEVAKTNAPTFTIIDLASTDDASSKSYKKALGQFRKLSSGSPYRSNDGLNLLEYVETGMNRRVWLTPKGHVLLQSLNIKEYDTCSDHH